MNTLKITVILVCLTGIAGAVEIIADDEDWGSHVLMSTWNVRGYPDSSHRPECNSEQEPLVEAY